MRKQQLDDKICVGIIFLRIAKLFRLSFTVLSKLNSLISLFAFDCSRTRPQYSHEREREKKQSSWMNRTEKYWRLVELRLNKVDNNVFFAVHILEMICLQFVRESNDARMATKAHGQYVIKLLQNRECKMLRNTWLTRSQIDKRLNNVLTTTCWVR